MDQQKLANTLFGALLSLGIQQAKLLLRPQPVIVHCDVAPVDLRSLLAGASLALLLLGAVSIFADPCGSLDLSLLL